MSEVNKIITKSGIIAILRGLSEENIFSTVEAILRGGINCIEVTLVPENEEKTAQSLEFIRKIAHKYQKDVLIGAGTVVTPGNVRKAVEAGAEYIVSPNTDNEVIRKTKDLDKISIPGAATPSEMMEARHAGADLIKFFPAAKLGAGYLKAVQGPLGEIPVLAVGGVNTENAEKFLQAGADGIGVGGGIVDFDAVDAGNFDEIENRAGELKKIVSG